MGEDDMSNTSLDELLLHLQSLPPGTVLSEILASLAPQDSAPAMSRVALVRWFDPEIYSLLCGDLNEAPDFEAFTAVPGITRLAPGRWHQSESARDPLLAAWHDPARLEEWRQWNGYLADHFHKRLKELGLEAKLAVLYHAAAGPEPAALVETFRAWFDAADKAFDMASANALLEMLKLQAQWRGEALSELYAELRAYCDTITGAISEGEGSQARATDVDLSSSRLRRHWQNNVYPLVAEPKAGSRAHPLRAGGL
jgi:hypothetical protein